MCVEGEGGGMEMSVCVLRGGAGVCMGVEGKC